MTDRDEADARYRAGLRDVLSYAAQRLDVEVVGEAVYGWRDRSIGAPVTTNQGRRWLRVVRELAEWTDGQFWTGNADATALPAEVHRPTVVSADEWDDGTLRCRAELMTLVDVCNCSPTPELRTPIVLDASWWASLRRSLAALAEVDTKRVAVTPDSIVVNLAVYFGVELDLSFLHWSAAHGDLQWGNLTQPDCWLLDWEAWGVAPAGMDAATLYCHSLLVPDVADVAYAAFAEVLDTPTGRVAQLHAAGRMLRRISDGDYPDLAVPLHRHARPIIAGLDPNHLQ